MDGSGRYKLRNVEDDRLSNLPDDLIHKILYDASIKHVMATSVLSTRWRFLWASTPYLNFSTEEFPNLPEFSKFVNHVLSQRNNLLPVFSVKLTFSEMVSEEFVKRIMDYGFSHNVQQLAVTLLPEEKVITDFPLSLINSKSLKHLTLNGRNYCCAHDRITSTWELPALTTLHLNNVILFCYDTTSLFSKCVNLKNLTLSDCYVGGRGIGICHSQLSDLTLINLECDCYNVVAPQLKNLTLRNYNVSPRICAPGLASLIIQQRYSCELISKDGFPALDKADMNMLYPLKSNASKILAQIQLLHNVKFLTLNLEIIQCLSSCVELISHQPCPFANLKSLKIYPQDAYWFDDPKNKVTISTQVINYFLDSSPSTTFTVISNKCFNYNED
ncbi:F-box domain, Leucine-rich repeat domain, L domain-like protein [Artemisia annua]|uniref:F-box domain, Leucine-rich repeat domain, L domain-like protein n=1 Tax=Artemisia annua TaxID=35608 RepID=A0A2U1MSU4_ARTAN|nr:F-box domain, Leucine-rich repeat domain, L domain-like protein [Artemisia annua]